MELRQLEYFQMIAHVNNITRAAELLHVSQPSLSTAMQKLEKELGVFLLDRSKKQIRLTNAGTIFLQRVDDILARVEDMVMEMNDWGQHQARTLKIGIPPMIGTFLFPHLFINYRNLFPDINLEISENGSMAIQELIEKGDLDLGIVIISETSHLLSTVPILQSEIVVCMHKNHPLSCKEKVSLAELKDESIIMLKEGFYNRNIIMDNFAKQNIHPQIVLSSNQLETIKSLIINGVGISFLFKETLRNHEDIVAIPFAQPIKETIGLTWKTDRYLSQSSRSFIEFINDSIQNIILPHSSNNIMEV